jgi:hypothetical protein
MTWLRWIAFVAGAAAAGWLAASPADASECDELSYQRNAIYKDAGYCFKTAAQIRNFGNAGCQFDDQADVPLSARQRAQVAAILRQERAAGCR